MTHEDWPPERADALSTAYRTLAQVNAAIIRAESAEQLYAEVCAVFVAEGGYLGAWIGTSERGSVTAVASAGAAQEILAELDLSMDPHDIHGQGPTVRALRDGQPSYLPDDGSGDPTVNRWKDTWKDKAADWGITAAVTTPLFREGVVVAVLSLYAGPGAVDEQIMRDLVEQVASSVSFALGHFAAAERLTEVAGQRETLMRRLVSAQEGERTRIANDIHDESVQSLVAVDLRLGLLQRQLLITAPDAVPMLRQIQDAVAGAVAGLRNLLFDLEPGSEEQGLCAAIRSAAWHILEGTDVTCTVVGDEVSDLPDVEFTQALRIVKEALTNVRKHASATSVDVRLARSRGGVEVVVADNGVGLDPLRTRRPGHRGLDTMRSRAEVTGGWFRVEPGAAAGTTIRFWVPLQARGAPPRCPRSA